MITVATYAGLLLLAALAAFQIALMFKAPLGNYAWGGSNIVLPNKLRIASASSLVLYAFFAIILALKADIFHARIDEGFVNVMIRLIAVYFCIGIVMNAVSRSKPERYLMTPIAVLLALIYLYVAVS